MTQKKQKTARKNDKKSIVNIPDSGYNEEQAGNVDEKSYKDFKELDLTNNFLFLKVMQDPELCRKLLEIILDVEIERIEYSEKEKTLDEKPEAKSVRLDDIFKRGRHIYTFENRCIQDTDIALGDETTKIFLNLHSEMDDVSPGLANFLKFLTDGKPVDEFTERLVEAVEAAKNNKMLELEYMSYYANLHDQYNEGLEAGHKAGLSEGLNEGHKAGLKVMVKTLKSILQDFDKVYNAIAGNEEYADITREEVVEYYQKCP